MLVFAHRGASGYEPENTLVAMDKALDLGAKAIELDVHCVEGELVVFHDRRLEGKSTGTGLIHLTTKQHWLSLPLAGKLFPPYGKFSNESVLKAMACAVLTSN